MSPNNPEPLKTFKYSSFVLVNAIYNYTLASVLSDVSKTEITLSM